MVYKTIDCLLPLEMVAIRKSSLIAFLIKVLSKLIFKVLIVLYPFETYIMVFTGQIYYIINTKNIS